MAAELCGAKLLAPVFGSSLHVWASVMGITLFALATGYFYGGQLSEKNSDKIKKLFQILILASLTLLVIPVISYYLLPRISQLSFIPAVIISTIALLFFPVFFMGASSPLFIAVQITPQISAGKASGSVYAISTLGGIISTFLCGKISRMPRSGSSTACVFYRGWWDMPCAGNFFGSRGFFRRLSVFRRCRGGVRGCAVALRVSETNRRWRSKLCFRP